MEDKGNLSQSIEDKIQIFGSGIIKIKIN